MFRLTTFATHAVGVESGCRKSETDASGLHGFEGAFETGPIRFTAERAPTRESACLGWATPLGSSAPCASSRDHAGREARRACHAVAHGRRRAPSRRCSSKASPASGWNSRLRSRADASICLLSRSATLPDNPPPRPLVRGHGRGVRSCQTLDAKEQRLATPAWSYCRTRRQPERKTPLEPRHPA